jgi:hypothetical protein
MGALAPSAEMNRMTAPAGNAVFREGSAQRSAETKSFVQYIGRDPLERISLFGVVQIRLNSIRI